MGGFSDIWPLLSLAPSGTNLSFIITLSSYTGTLTSDSYSINVIDVVRNSKHRNMTVASTSTATTPLRRLAVASTVNCSTEASAYGKCILQTYTDMRKDACKEEFAKFGACLRQVVS